MNNDPVSPDHYKVGGLEVIDIMQAKLTKEEFEGYLKGNIIKYTLRARHKNGLECQEKCVWYAKKLVEINKVVEFDHIKQ